MRLSLITGTCLTLSLMGAFLLLPRHRTLAAQDVRQAFEGARSWHLTGWKMDGDKRLVWEVWGQRAPFFYRERVGDRETLDNGQYRYLALPPVMPGQAGVVLKTPSRGNSNTLAQSFPALQRLTRIGEVWKREGSHTTYSVSETWMMSLRPLRRNDLYTFAPDSPLPKQYSQNLQQYGRRSRSESFDEKRIAQGPVEKQWEDAHLEAEYNLPIPPEAAHIEAKPGYRLIDATQNTLPPGVEAENAVASHGITLQADPAMVDAQGNIALVLRPWIGNQDLGGRKHEDLLPLQFSLRQPDMPRINSVGDVEHEEMARATIAGMRENNLFFDDRGRAYLPLHGINGLYFAQQPSLMVLAPLEPLKPNEPLPRQITIRVFGDVDTSRRISGTKESTDEGLLTEPLTLAVNLPTRPRPFDDRIIARDILHIEFVIGDGCERLNEALLSDRADYYIQRFLQYFVQKRNTPEGKALYQNAVRWHEKAIAGVRPDQRARLQSNLKTLQTRYAHR